MQNQDPNIFKEVELENSEIFAEYYKNLPKLTKCIEDKKEIENDVDQLTGNIVEMENKILDIEEKIQKIEEKKNPFSESLTVGEFANNRKNAKLLRDAFKREQPEKSKNPVSRIKDFMSSQFSSFMEKITPKRNEEALAYPKFQFEVQQGKQ